MDLNLISSSYKGKKVFLTGHTGFKGSWMLKLLSILGAKVKGYALAPENDNDLFHLIKGSSLCESVINDIRNKELLEKELIEFQPDFIFHLAAQPLVRLSYEIPLDTFDINAMGTAYLLDAARKLNNPCTIILITTDKVYENKEWIYPYRETDNLGGFDPYSASKACAEIIISSYRNSFFHISKFESHQKGIAVGRAGNVIGGGDWSKDRIIPDMVKALSKNEVIQVRNPRAIRPWQHVLEPIGGYLLLGAKLQSNPKAFSEAYNFGPFIEDNLTVEDLIKIGINSWQSGSYSSPNLTNQVHEAGLLKLDISKAIEMLGWKPKLKSKDAISLTVNWYKEYFKNPASINEYTEREIRNYLGI